jgi:hypothetical protein
MSVVDDDVESSVNYWSNDDDTTTTTTSSCPPIIYPEVDDSLAMWEAITLGPATHRPHYRPSILIRAFAGGDKAVQRHSFFCAVQHTMSAVGKKYNVSTWLEYMDTKSVSKKRWGPEQLIDWLLQSNMHFITAHVHQGLRSHGLSWNLSEFLPQLQRLKYHVGFPSGDQLRCPVFTQDKFEYLRHLGDMANNTFVVYLTSDGVYEATTLAEIERFLKIVKIFLQGIVFTFMMLTIRFINVNNEGCGWVIKAPFTTNGECVKFAKSMERIVYFLRACSKKYYGEIPYVMIQACMYNRKEYKVVALGGEPLYIAAIGSEKKSTDGVNRAFGDEDELLQFAKLAVKRLLSSVPHAITDGLFRVDIFQDKQNKFVVNEFESLDANYDGNEMYECLTTNFIRAYWKKITEEKFAECNMSLA